MCTAFGGLVQYFYTAAASWMWMEGHACFTAVTTGVIGGRLKAYFAVAWGKYN